jgi:hypothetical protein
VNSYEAKLHRALEPQDPEVQRLPLVALEGRLGAHAEQRRAQRGRLRDRIDQQQSEGGSVKGLMVHVLRSARLGDCTNGGVSSKVDAVVLVGPGIDPVFEAREDMPALYLGEYMGRKIVTPEPLNGRALGGVSGKWWMFGGNFIYSSDSRFACLTPGAYPIPVYDRYEAPDKERSRQGDRRGDWKGGGSVNVLGIYIFNSTRNAWLQDDERTWGSFSGAVEYTEGNEALAEDIRERVSGDDVTFTMAALH